MPDDILAINHLLRSKGLAGLDQPRELFSQMGHLVRDHAHFRSMLNACDPSDRRQMYEALKPNLTFKAKDLWQYESEMSYDAEVRQLPTIDANGALKPFRVSEARALSDRVSEVIAKEHLILVCAKCTREEAFHGMTKYECVLAARAAGWKQRKRNGKREAGCPQCTTTKPQTNN
jgi:hypothetical protein